MKYIRLKNWGEFQHYKTRHAPWLKLYGSLFTTQWWVMGNDASKLLAICLMVLALRNDNKIPLDFDYIKKFSHLETTPDFEPLIQAQFIEIYDESGVLHNASNTLASCNREKRREEKSRHQQADDPRFAQFWSIYPKKKAKGDAEKAWKKAKINGEFEQVLEAVRKQSKSEDWIKDGGQFIPFPATWINQKRWLDDSSGVVKSIFAGAI